MLVDIGAFACPDCAVSVASCQAATPGDYPNSLDEAQKAWVIFELEVEPVPSDPKPISIPADLPLRVMTISSRSASRRNREVVLISDSGTRLTPDLRISLAMPMRPM
jgi:hypothetical protein